MRKILSLILVFLVLSCEQRHKEANQQLEQPMQRYNLFDKQNHLRPLFDKTKFDTSHSWDFGWAVLEPINIATDQETSEIELSKRLSPGQKALYFFWYLDEEVTNGGFIQFYWNGYQKYIAPISEGLKLIGDTDMIELVEKVDQEYLLHRDKFNKQRQKGDWSPLYDNLKNFEKYDESYYKMHDNTMELIEKYVRQHPDDFIKFK